MNGARAMACLWGGQVQWKGLPVCLAACLPVHLPDPSACPAAQSGPGAAPTVFRLTSSHKDVTGQVRSRKGG